MLELNSKPKKLVIQRHTNSNNWLTEAVMYKDENEKGGRRWTEEEVYYLLETYSIGKDDFEDCPVRILNEHGKVILSTASREFLVSAGRSGHITVKEPVFDEEGNEVGHTMCCYSEKNKAYTHMREFQKFIGRHKGISHVTKYPRDEKDGWEQVWKVYFKDGSAVTVGTHHLYLLDNMLVSWFARDKVNY